MRRETTRSYERDVQRRFELQGRLDDALDYVVRTINAGQGVVSAEILRDILDPERTRSDGGRPSAVVVGYPPTAMYTGSSKSRQEVGKPGHCERCAEHGHVRAHPGLGCGDVGCTSAHDEPPYEPKRGGRPRRVEG